jgi:hypothetical protein
MFLTTLIAASSVMLVFVNICCSWVLELLHGLDVLVCVFLMY